MSGKPKKAHALETPELPANLVPHPRYGTSTKASGYKLSVDDVRADRHLARLARGSFWPKSAIPGPALVTGSPYAWRYYVDRLCRCVDCYRPFIFYAVEQRLWFERLGFHVESHAVRCTSCRRSVRKVKQRRDRIEGYLAALKDMPGPLTRDVLSDAELRSLATDLLALAEIGAIKRLHLLNRLRRAMLERLERSDDQAFDALVKRIDKLSGPSKRSTAGGGGLAVRP